MKFKDLRQKVSLTLWPDGEPETLFEAVTLKVEEALADLQRYLPGTRLRQRSIYPQSSTYFSCGLTVLPKPNGFIDKVYTGCYDAQAGTVGYCSRLELAKSDYDNLEKWSRRFYLLTKDVVVDTSHFGPIQDAEFATVEFSYPSKLYDSKFGRAIIGKYAIHNNKIYVAPYIQSDECVIVEWNGIKTEWNDADDIIIKDEVTLVAFVANYVGRYVSLMLDNGAKFPIYNSDYREKRADLMLDETEEQFIKNYKFDYHIDLALNSECGVNRITTDEVIDYGKDPILRESAFAILGDPQQDTTALRAIQSLITNIYKPSIILTTGDNDELENLGGSAPYSRTAIKYFSGYILNNEIAELSKNTANFFWPIKGNHDISQSNDFENIFKAIFSVSSNQLFRKTYYDLFAGPCHFIMLDTSNGSLSDEQKSWLKYRLGLSTSTWRIILTHFPVYASSDTNHDMINPASMYSDIDFNYADIVISGHHHINEIIKKNNTYFINLGTSSFVRSLGLNKLSTADGVLYQNDANNCFISGRADCNSLELKLINKDNQILFTITDNERNS